MMRPYGRLERSDARRLWLTELAGSAAVVVVLYLVGVVVDR